eukprot:sb/3460999/
MVWYLCFSDHPCVAMIVMSALRVDQSDLECRVWTCSKYPHLYSSSPSSPCTEVLSDAIKFRTHIRRAHQTVDFPKQFLCPVPDCNQFTKVWTRFQFLRNHYDCMHRDGQPYTCSVCTKTFSSRTTWKRHYRDCSSGLIQCGQCERKFSGYSSLSRHVKEKHTQDRQTITATSTPTDAGARLIISLVKEIQQMQANMAASSTSTNSELGNTILIETRPPTQSTPQSESHCESHCESQQQQHDLLPEKRRRLAALPTPVPPVPTGWAGWGDTRPEDGYHFEVPNSATRQQQQQHYWNEFSTQTVTEHSSFGTQTLLCSDDPFSLSDCDFVEYLDGEVQTEERVDRVCFASQTAAGKDGQEGGPTSDRDCQTNWYTNSIQTQTKVRKERENHGGIPPENDGRNWKLMIDPALKGKSTQKVIRYEGVLEGPNVSVTIQLSGQCSDHSSRATRIGQANALTVGPRLDSNTISITLPLLFQEVPTLIRDPRFASLARSAPLVDLKIPKFKFDKWSVGSPVMKSIFIYGLNDNVNQDFLTEQFSCIGQIDQLKVYYHPKTKKHLGIAFVSFSLPSVAKEVIAKFHGTSIMGNVVHVKPDPMCHITKRVLDHLIKGQTANIPEIIEHVELKYQHKTAAVAFKTNERSPGFYTARGKDRKPGDTPAHTTSYGKIEKMEFTTPTKREPPPQKSPQKVDTPPAEEISPIAEDEDVVPNNKKQCREVSPTPMDQTDHHSSSHHHRSHNKPNKTMDPDPRHDPRLYELEKEQRRKSHSEHGYEEWKMRDELQIRAEKTNRYIREHHDYYSDKYPPLPTSGGGETEKRRTSSDKYGMDVVPPSGYYHGTSSSSYYSGYYEKYYKSSSSKDRGRYPDDKHSSSSSRSKYDKYRYDDKYYRSESSSKFDYKKAVAEVIKGASTSRPSYNKESSEYYHYGSPKDGKSRSRPRDEAAGYLAERYSKRKRSKSPSYHHHYHHGSPAALPEQAAIIPKPSTPKTGKGSNSESVNSRDTGYHSVSPPVPSPAVPSSSGAGPPPPVPAPPPEYDFSTLTENPYGCSRACPRKDIAAIKEIGAKAEDPGPDSMSTSSMSLGGESDVEMQVEDISPNTTPAPPQPPIPILPVLPPTSAVQYGQWIHNTYPAAPEMYSGFAAYPPTDYYSSARAAEILARREAEETAEKQRREERLAADRRDRSFNMLHHLMENVLSRDLKIRLTEKVAFSSLEQAWNEEEDRKKREEEELMARKREERVAQGEDPDVPNMPSLSEMRTMSDAKQTSHIRQTNLTFKVPKLNRGLRAQVIVKKVHKVQKMDSTGEQSDEEQNEEDLVKRRKQGNRYQTIYSSSSSSSSESSEEEEEEEEEKEEETKPEIKESEPIAPAP